MKGIILAGGKGTRLAPITNSISKQLIPIYDKPMIYYPLSSLMLTGIKEILIISTPEDMDDYRKLLGNGNQLGLSLEYKEQSNPNGLAEAFILGEEFIGDSHVSLILGDNFFYGQHLSQIFRNAANLDQGARIFGYYTSNPSDFGVVEFNEKNEVISLEEKPENPKSNYAVPGFYFYDNKVVEYAKSLEPSERGELEITDLNKIYLNKNQLKIELFGRGMAWLDTGTPRGLLEAANFVEAIQNRQGFYISAIEEIAYRMEFITKDDLLELSKDLSNSEYGKYLKKIALS